MEPLQGATVERMSIGTLDELDGAASARRRRRFRVAAGACALLVTAMLALRVAAAVRKLEDTQNVDGTNHMPPVPTVGLYNPATNRWLAVTYQGGANAPLEGPVFDHGSVVSQFVLRYNQDGTVGLQNPATGRWVRVTDQGGADSPSMGPWQSAWQWERFEQRQV